MGPEVTTRGEDGAERTEGEGQGWAGMGRGGSQVRSWGGGAERGWKEGSARTAVAAAQSGQRRGGGGSSKEAIILPCFPLGL